jgi:hypothetical protein
MVNYKIVVFVPDENLDAVRDAMADAGAGVIGNYTCCSFASPGTGTFFGGEGADLAAMRAAHPYEEPAYDVYELIDI